MKTAISVPDDTFSRASKRAADLGVSRSEFFSRAAARYLDELDRESATHLIDSALTGQTDHEDSAADAVAVGRRVVRNGPGDW